MSTEQSKDQPPSTLQSYINSATGAVQSAVGSLTGNKSLEAEGEVAKEQGETEHEQSQAALKVGSHTVSSSGGIAKDSKDRTDGSWNQTIGAAKEAVGGLIGNEVCPLILVCLRVHNQACRTNIGACSP